MLSLWKNFNLIFVEYILKERIKTLSMIQL